MAETGRTIRIRVRAEVTHQVELIVVIGPICSRVHTPIPRRSPSAVKETNPGGAMSSRAIPKFNLKPIGLLTSS